MTERLGSGEWVFEVNDGWAKIPDEIVLGDVAAVGVDSKDNVYAFNRGDHPVAVFDKAGNLLRTLGEGASAVPLLVVRRDDQIDVLSARCSHLAGPLHEGTIDIEAGCVTCPWHGIVFSLEDGSVRSGPATAPVHAFDVRVDGGRLMVRLPNAG